MPFWRRTPSADAHLPKHDRGSGSLDDYDYDLVPNKKSTTMRLAGSDAHQDELVALSGEDPEALTTATPARSLEQEKVDAPLEIRVFAGRRVSGVVGTVPRGLEGVVDEAIRRLEGRGDKPRIPIVIAATKHGYRVDLQMGLTR